MRVLMAANEERDVSAPRFRPKNVPFYRPGPSAVALLNPNQVFMFED